MPVVKGKQVANAAVNIVAAGRRGQLRLGIFYAGNKLGAFCQRQPTRPESHTRTSLFIPIHSPPIVDHAEEHCGHCGFRIAVCHKTCEQYLPDLPWNSFFEPLRDDTNQLLVDCARPLAETAPNPPPERSAYCMDVIAGVIPMSVILARDE